MRIFYIVLLCFLFVPALAQQPGSSSRSDLEKRRQSIMDAIRETQEQLELTKKDKNASLAQLKALQSKLAERQRLIGNINQEIGEINKDIQYSAKEIETLRQNLSMLKIRYAQSIRYAYKNRASYNMIAFLFSSTDFNEAIRRLKYLKKYRDYRKEQADQIRTTHTKIEKKIGELNTVKSQKDVLRLAEEQQRLAVQQEANETDRVVKELKGREKELAVQIDRNRKAARQVDVAIQKIIQREIELARKKAEEDERRRREEEQRRIAAAAAANSGGMTVNTGSGTRTTGTVPRDVTPNVTTKPGAEKPAPRVIAANTRPAPPRPTTSFVSNLTPEATALSNSFETNRGRLPWPVDKGYISQGFGTYKHPLEEKVTLENYGVDITTNPGTTVRSVFDGVVTKVFFVAGRNYNVMISHGAFFTVYSGLTSVSVKADQEVHTKQALGVAGPNDEGSTILNFQIWKVGKSNQTSKLDPAQWIAR